MAQRVVAASQARSGDRAAARHRHRSAHVARLDLREEPSNSEPVRELDRDGYYLRIAGDYEEGGAFPARIWFTAHSPCVGGADK